MDPGQKLVLDFLLIASVTAATLGGLAWFAGRTDEHQDAIEAQVDRIDRSLREHRAYIAERDRLWAASLGLPGPPGTGTPDDGVGDGAD